MEASQIRLSCFNAIAGGLVNADHGWDIAAADLLRSAMLKRSLLPEEVSAADIYQLMLPAFDFGTTDTDPTPFSYQAPGIEELRREGINTSSLEGKNMQAVRVYLKMDVQFDEQGNMTPKVLHWENGRKFRVDQVLDVRKLANLKENSTGGTGLRFTCKILDKVRFLWFSDGKWFVEYQG